jgi:DNA invertase Pin-like site-specific DNA recombinase
MKAISYRRVSTQEQGSSGLGLESQKYDIDGFCQSNGIELISHYQEVASAKGNYANRTILMQALAHCKKERCHLIVSKLDRLSRDVESIASLMNSRVEFIVVQLGLDADNFQLHLFASLAQKERDWISQRTKAALKAKRERNEPLGNLASLPQAQESGVKTIIANADVFAAKLSHLVLNYRSQGLSLAKIAQHLNLIGVATPRGGDWHAQSVKNLLDRL